ncbi:nucleoside deaminase [Streptomyces telluris]|uniref:Nucleoside deaminase n=1 Tax=Streptomyces telluris TaxID=2720021 RepID=A0A9X2RQY2_9ACTN|nr:nucleoside deaminase [Streptomyces telluris]MCQ8772936.1 nucleoside deaminase [Streptomyces telluris]NJP78488.1 nucleoside deaminase [Streptomyces telluris]
MTPSHGQASRRHFLRTAAAAAPIPALGALAPAAHAESGADGFPARSAEGRQWIGEWPAHLKEAAVHAMPVAVEWARRARWPFGAVLLDAGSGAVVAGARNTTDLSGDDTAHAETGLLREAAAAGRHLPGYAVVSTAEPCAMCAGALLWAGVRAVAYGTSVARLISYGVPQIDLSFTEITRRSLLSRPAVGRDVCSELTDPLYRDLTR